ncbi:MAG: hypothetical protein COA79_00825 [Planctomycetota bacterium]|nr:MAG: hypothetical protein COA79_00825 [Planctomycetota bacterium]
MQFLRIFILNILIIDDEKDFTDCLRSHLRLQHDTCIFNDSIEALEHFEAYQDYDIVIIDYIMPKLNGDEFIERICEIKPFQNIIISSGDINKSDLNKIKKYNNSIKMITKPFDLSDLDELLFSFNAKST